MVDQSSIIVPLFRPFIPPGAAAEINRVLDSGYLGEGPRVKQFEAQLAALLALDPVQLVALNSCTSAISLALHLAGVRPGDEVISTPMTCVATNNPILLAGAHIRWADVDRFSGNIDPESVRGLVSPKTKAIIAVDWGGLSCDWDVLAQIARDARCLLIEDAAHAFGASFRGKPTGHHADLVCFSFQSIKLITTGDGGLLVCRSAEIAARARRLRWLGIDRAARSSFADYVIDEPGFKYHMNDLAAALGLAALPHVPALLAHRAAIASLYRSELAGVPGIEVYNPPPHCRSAHWLFTLCADNRERLSAALREQGIETSVVHKRNDLFPAFPKSEHPLPGLDVFSRKMLCVPIGHWVTPAQAHQIAHQIRRIQSS